MNKQHPEHLNKVLELFSMTRVKMSLGKKNKREREGDREQERERGRERDRERKREREREKNRERDVQLLKFHMINFPFEWPCQSLISRKSTTQPLCIFRIISFNSYLSLHFYKHCI